MSSSNGDLKIWLREEGRMDIPEIVRITGQEIDSEWRNLMLVAIKR